MRYKLLGKSGLRVSELCLGTMTFGEDWGWGASKDESARVFDAFVEAGGNFIDTANGYTDGSSEKIVGEFIAKDRERFVVATKYSFPLRMNEKKGDPNGSGNHRKNLIQSLEGSLKRLNTDYIDLFWLHAWDFTTPIEEVLRSLDDVVRQGKVLYIGISDAPAWIVSQANTIAQYQGWTPFVALQIEYSLIQRTPERDLLPMAKAFDLAVTPWSPLGGGVLTGKYNKSSQKSGESGRLGNSALGTIPEKSLAIAEVVTQVAAEIGHTPSQVALAWLRAQTGVIIPVVGVRKLTQFQDNLGSLDVTLSPEHLQRLNEVSQIDLGFPHEFLYSDVIRDRLFGGTFNAIDNHRI
ncbi:aldo/keto reductase [Nostoc linckia z18]|jgi:aryl-alcohol dehydrogenase-like predicted oxidoreductase|uniref:Aldo/keto reductase n=2 Tax=Nostoc linckia TaxID=92942 RepID=A0A9Q5Z6Q5_NOSLI|nr:aldo/keto reductase [Nostoc linckia]PHK41480.1 aldo/keto reductase [Nostoc linckia z15]PHK44176.1 aldo/keto reductase [Nostoc linckia z16]PHJ69242.1 aldo/keto reductase [Nostoc linckia z1]PHJ73393.1 aldo/keto reductase [Nostoc linckia z3]PHJ78740.1 aldo/keto reductase [Nostoc linckia z2]